MSGGGGCLLEIINGGRVHALNICSGVAAMVLVKIIMQMILDDAHEVAGKIL
jgi:hypothetical protein